MVEELHSLLQAQKPFETCLIVINDGERLFGNGRKEKVQRADQSGIMYYGGYTAVVCVRTARVPVYSTGMAAHFSL